MPLNRRSILAGAAALPVTVVPALASDDHDVFALADRALKARTAEQAAVKAYNPFDAAMVKWRKKTRPKLREYKRTTDEDFAAYIGDRLINGEECKTPNPDADYHAAQKELKARMKEWKATECAEEDRCGHTAAYTAMNAAIDRTVEAVEELTETEPRTWVGISAKAKVALSLEPEVSEELRDSILEDIVRIAGNRAATGTTMPHGRH